ncbi:hypothetical protein niasHS_012859 [Heterodera schachtii]|uniref:Uncharacterized protein n=1 Tax=Heterodera schachtii TaxID=97005 RepID=A0ABD2IA15_HETSC
MSAESSSSITNSDRHSVWTEKKSPCVPQHLETGFNVDKICKTSKFRETADFSSSGQHKRWGKYKEQIEEFGKQDVALPFQLLKEVYIRMDPKIYDLNENNCQTCFGNAHDVYALVPV